MAEPFSKVLDEIRAIKAGGGGVEDARAVASRNGWTLEDLKTAYERGGTAQNILSPIMQGVSMGWADEGKAGLRHLTEGVPYDKALADEAAVLKRAQTEHPLGSAVAEIGGSVLPALGAAPLAVGRGLVGTTLRNIGLGAAEGAVAGAGQAQPGERVEGAAPGAVVGSLLGAAVPTAVSGAQAAYRGLRAAVTPDAAAQAEIRRAATRDSLDIPTLTARSQNLETVRPGTTTLADAGGENMRGLVERVAQTPGAGRAIVAPFLEGRQRGQFVRLSNDLRQLSGTHRTATQAVEQVTTARAAAARPLYQQAMGVQVENDPALVAAWQDVTARGWGQQLLSNPSLRRTLQTEYGIDDPAQAPLMVLIDSWKKEADDQIETATRSGARNVARVVGGMRDRIVTLADQANPDYAAARSAWAGPSAYLDAVEQGRRIEQLTGEEVTGLLARYGNSEREAFRTGAVTSLIGSMAKDSAELPNLTKKLRSPGMREKVAALMPTPGLQARWGRTVDAENDMSSLAQRATRNSRTHVRGAEEADVAGNLAGGFLADIAGGSGLLSAAAKWATGMRQSAVNATREETDTRLARFMTSPDVQQRLRELRTITPPPGYAGVPTRSTVAPTLPATGGLLGLLGIGEKREEFPF